MGSIAEIGQDFDLVESVLFQLRVPNKFVRLYDFDCNILIVLNVDPLVDLPIHPLSQQLSEPVLVDDLDELPHLSETIIFKVQCSFNAI